MRNEKLTKSIAEGRVDTLFRLAKSRTLANMATDRLSRRYIGIAESIISHYRVGRNTHIKMEVCKKCKSILVPGMNCSVRLASNTGYRVILCICGEEKHLFYR
ncbi:MAG: ribonuclease P [Candidatus Marsarchaeota archaeon]|nr:ribonuclease P [Candidatus Marsarchaeota archaeon]MCL5413157.1 ribonuclease P [Candidatus Marsarchaeota archaeon]